MLSLSFAHTGTKVTSPSAQLRGTILAINDSLPAQSAGRCGAAATWLLGAASAAATTTAVISRVKSRQRPAHALRIACRAGEAAIETPPTPPPPPPFNPAQQIGVTQPVGYFDPLGFCKVGDERGFHKLRCSELKHGRVAMMAAVGAVFQHYVHFPGCESVPNGLKAALDPVGLLAELFLVPVVGFLELIYWKDDLSKEPGNFGDPADWAGTGLGGAGSYSDEMRNKEINNGRAAMFSIAGIIAAELATGKDAIQQFGLP